MNGPRSIPPMSWLPSVRIDGSFQDARTLAPVVVPEASELAKAAEASELAKAEAAEKALQTARKDAAKKRCAVALAAVEKINGGAMSMVAENQEYKKKLDEFLQEQQVKQAECARMWSTLTPEQKREFMPK